MNAKNTSPGYLDSRGPAFEGGGGDSVVGAFDYPTGYGDFDAHTSPLSTPPIAVASGTLQLDLALRLLERSGHRFPVDAKVGSPTWMQSLVDGLCNLSSRDPLTGLPNRREFESALEQQVDRVARSGEPAVLLLFDIDHFKRINDTWGHAVGDLVIQAIAHGLQDSVRPMDSVARLGGEEFGAVLPNCPPAFGHMVAERVRRNIEAMAIPIGQGRHVQVTVSVGGAYAPQWVRSSRTIWLERADQQLYRAKDEGRNRTCLETPMQTDVSAAERGMLLGASPSTYPPESETSAP